MENKALKGDSGMDIYTAVLSGKELSKVLHLPNEFINAEVEVKVKVLKKLSVRKKSKFNTFFGITKIDNIDEEIKLIRDDWK